MKKFVFLDHNATTFPSTDVTEGLKSFKDWGNPSSIHGSGRRAKAVVLQTRRLFSEIIGVSPGEIIFTSGGSESNNLALKGLIRKLIQRGLNHIVTSSVEHPSVLKVFESFEERDNIKVHKVPVTVSGGFDYEFLSKTISKNPVGLVSVMYANNETGEVFDLPKIRKIIDTSSAYAKNQKIYFHSDMVQSLGKSPLDLKESGPDLASFSAHKFYSLQGTGVLYQKKGVGLEPLIHGGSQEKGRRAGTENLLSIYAFGLQLKNLKKLTEKIDAIKTLRDHFEKRLSDELSGVTFIAQNRKRLSNTSMVLIDEAHGETLLMNLDLNGFQVSTGAACSSGNPEPSPVLLAMGLTPEQASHSLRVSLGWQTTKEDIDSFVDELKKVVEKLRSL